MAKSSCWNAIVSQPLTGKKNYEDWKGCMETYLRLRDLWELSSVDSGSGWEKQNLEALHAIKISCAPHVLSLIRETSNAWDAWWILAEKFGMTEDFGCEYSAAPDDLGLGRDLDLLKAIKDGNLDYLNERRNSGQLNHSFALSTGRRGTAIHQATISGKVDVVRYLVEAMPKDDILRRDHRKLTPLHIAAADGRRGKIDVAKCIIDKYPSSVKERNPTGCRLMTPLDLACEKGHKDMSYYLYEKSRDHVLSRGSASAGLAIYHCISGKMFDIAWDLLLRCPSAADSVMGQFSIILALARQRDAFLTGSRLLFWQLWIYKYCLKVNIEAHIDLNYDQSQNNAKLRRIWSYLQKLSGIPQLRDLKLTHLYAEKVLELMSEWVKAFNSSKKSNHPSVLEALSTAAQLGITEFIIKIIGDNPDLLGVSQIFSTAVKNRQEKVFSLIYGLEAGEKDVVASVIYKGNDNLLHLAGQLAPQHVLDGIPGAALQMQRELQWFKEVEGIVPEVYKTSRNGNDETPTEVFNESHKELSEQGARWMKDIAQSSTVVGALIITIMFAALFTVPGGNNQDTGFPVFRQRKAFKVFLFSDTISLSTSSASVLMFLGLLTSRYAPNDFLVSLPTKLIIALSTLFISIATMMIAFCSTVILMVEGKQSYVIPVVLLACIPVLIFVWMQFPLLITVARFTYLPMFDRRKKPWQKAGCKKEASGFLFCKCI